VYDDILLAWTLLENTVSTEDFEIREWFVVSGLLKSFINFNSIEKCLFSNLVHGGLKI